VLQEDVEHYDTNRLHRSLPQHRHQAALPHAPEQPSGCRDETGSVAS
jgi:hypothetical protein